MLFLNLRPKPLLHKVHKKILHLLITNSQIPFST